MDPAAACRPRSTGGSRAGPWKPVDALSPVAAMPSLNDLKMPIGQMTELAAGMGDSTIARMDTSRPLRATPAACAVKRRAGRWAVWIAFVVALVPLGAACDDEAISRTQGSGFTVAQTLDVAAVVLALVMLAIWMRRRTGRERGIVSALLVVALARDIVSTGAGDAGARASGGRARRGLRRALLALAIVLIVGAPAHDLFFLRASTSVMDRPWLPFATPLLLLIFAWALLDRLGRALVAMQAQAGDLERKVARRTRELEVANAAKTRFLAAASHDLRQPVVSISLLSELLREQPLPASAAPILARMGDSVQALTALLESLLDLSRFDAGAVTARPSSIALRALLERVTGDEAEAARRLGITLRIRAPLVNVRSDPLLLEQILRNLVGNAVRYTRRGGVLVSARRRGADRLLLQVWDTGPGIPSESQAQVFDEFVQLDNAAREAARGLGLGLSLVQRAAAVLGVRVCLRSAVGRGSCFSLEVPLGASEAAHDETAPADDPGLDGCQVWILEDDPDVREALRMRLVAWGAQARAFSDVDSFRQALAGGPPDLLVADQRLPDGTGIDAARLLQAVDASVPVLVVTGDTAPDDIALLRASGLPVLHKPFTSNELWVALRALGGASREAV